MKQQLEVIRIIEEVRRSGHEVSLLICGQRDHRRYERRLRAAAARRPWVSVVLDAPHEAMLNLISSCRYGIHAMPQEHFGIAVAEMVRAGCVCFAHRDGGTAEILGNDRRLLFASPQEAVERICALLASPAEIAKIRTQLAAQAKAFSAERFMTEFRQSCLDAAGEGSLPGRETAATTHVTAA
jgi:glycosyltransferase involved in cell wall biosynthesis